MSDDIPYAAKAASLPKRGEPGYELFSGRADLGFYTMLNSTVAREDNVTVDQLPGLYPEVIKSIEESYNKKINDLRKLFRATQFLAREVIELVKPYAKPHSYITDRDLLAMDWGYSGWSGAHVRVDLHDKANFGDLTEAYEHISNWFREKKFYYHVRDTGVGYCVISPDPDDYAEIGRRAWTWQVNPKFYTDPGDVDIRFTLMAFIGKENETCKIVQEGFEPKMKLLCWDTPK